jgi:hypothetical protein
MAGVNRMPAPRRHHALTVECMLLLLLLLLTL